MTDKRNLTISDLIEGFSNAGMYISGSWIRRQEEKGNLTVPKSTTNFKMVKGIRKPGAVRVFSREDINNIVKAFMPTGSRLPNGEIASGTGYFNYKKDN